MPAAAASRTAPATDAAPSDATIGCPAGRPARKHRPPCPCRSIHGPRSAPTPRDTTRPATAKAVWPPEGRTAEAEAGLRQALAILQRIGAANAVDVSAELDALPGTPDPASAS